MSDERSEARKQLAEVRELVELLPDLIKEVGDMRKDIKAVVREVKKQAPPKALATEEECREFARSKGLPAESGSWFFNNMEGKGWRVNGRKVVKWRGTFSSWLAAGHIPATVQNVRPAARGI